MENDWTEHTHIQPQPHRHTQLDAQLVEGHALHLSQASKKDENGFLQSDLRGEQRESKVVCLGCSCRERKCGEPRWNRHVLFKHTEDVSQKAAQQVGEAPKRRAKRADVEPAVLFCLVL